MKTTTTTTILLTLTLFILLTGCSAQYERAVSSKVGYANDAAKPRVSKANSAGAESVMAGKSSTELAATSAAVKNRKIIYDTKIGLVVEDYTSFENQLPLLVSKHGGFIASNKTDRRYNDQQSGTWVVRLPVDQYADFLTGVDSLGFAESRTENAQDVTEEYVDLTARIKNKKQLETRVLEMLENQEGPLKDVLEIERELSRIREAVERMEGRIRFLQDRTSLATITIKCREQKEYQPAQAPTLASRMNQSWSNSILALQRGGENFLVALIGSIPWLVVFGLVASLFVICTKKYWRLPSFNGSGS